MMDDLMRTIESTPPIENVYDQSDESSLKDRFMPEELQSADIVIEFKTVRACRVDGTKRKIDWSRPSVYSFLDELDIYDFTVKKVKPKHKKAYLNIKQTRK